MADIAKLWQRLEAWGAANAPKMLEDLNPGATDAQIDELQTAIGRELPASYIASLKVHNGESDGWPFKVFADMGAYYPSERIPEYWNMRRQVAEQVGLEFSAEEVADQVKNNIITVEGPVRPATHRAEWIPVLDCNGDVFWAIDFAPADGGSPGQIIQVDLEGGYWAVVADSFEKFLANYVEALEAGAFPVQSDGLPSKEEN